MAEVPELLEGAVGRGADDDVVEDFQAKQLPASDEFPGDTDVGVARGRVAPRMVVHHQDGVGRRDDGRTEHFPRMHEHLIEDPDRNDVVPLHASPRGQQQGDEPFLFRVVVRHGGDVSSPVFDGLRRRIAEMEPVGVRTVAQRDHLVLLG